MPIRSIDELRNWAGPDWKSASDEDLISMYSRAAKVPPTEVAMTLGYDPGSGGVSAKQLSSSVDRYQAGLYGVGEAVTGAIGLNKASGWLAEQRRANELQADVASARAREMGAVDTWKDVKDVGDFGSYAKSLAIQSLPYAGEALVGGMAARGLMSGTRAALTGAKTVEEAAAAKRALDIGSTAGGVAASYPSAVGDILSNQREQTGGKTDLLAAGGLAIPYAGLNALGIDSALMRGGVFRNTINLLDRPGGLLGAATRTVATGTGVALKEGISETGQEVLNQAGRMAVDPNATLTDPEALERYKEAFAGGATLGGIMGGGLGGWRRSNPATNEIQQAFEQPNVSGTPTTNVAPPAAPPAPQQNVPAVVGGTTDIAQAQQQAQIDNQAAQIQQQQAEQTQAIQAQRDSVASYFGAEPAIENGKLVGGTIFGKSYADPEKFNAELDKLAQNESVKTETRRAVEKAYMDSLPPEKRKLNTIQSGALQFWANKPDIAAAAAAINEAMSELVVKGKGIDDPKVTQFAQMYEALTGTEAPAYDAATKVKPKGAKDGKLPLQTTTGLGAVSVESGAGQANDGNDGNVQSSNVQSVGTGSLPTGSLGLQTGQQAGEGIRTGTGADTSIVDGNASTQVTAKPAPETNQLLRQLFGDSYVINEKVPPATIGPAKRVAGKAGQVYVQPSQTGQSGLSESVPASMAGERVVKRKRRWNAADSAPVPGTNQYYSSAVEHIHPTKRSEIILGILVKALEPQTDRGDEFPAIIRAQILKMSLMEQMTSAQISQHFAEQETPIDISAESIDTQRRRMGLADDRGVRGIYFNTEKEAGRQLMQDVVKAASEFKTDAFPDGIGPDQLKGFYAAKNSFATGNEVVELSDEVFEEPVSRTTDVKLQEELYKSTSENEATQSMGQIASAGGSQGNVDSLKQTRKDKKTGKVYKDISALAQIEELTNEADTIRDTLMDMAPKDPRREGLVSRLEAIGDVDSGEIGGLFQEYNKAQQLRSKEAEEAGVIKKEEVESTKEELTGEELAASEREDERRKDAEEKAKADQEGKADAVQEPSAEEVPVRKRTEGGKKVGKGNAQGGKAAGKTEVKVEPKQEVKSEEIKTPAEEWANISKLAPELPPYDVLTSSEKTRWDDLVRRGQANLAAAVKIVGEVTQPTGTALANQGPQATGAIGTTQAVTNEADVIDVEARVIDETVGPQVAALPAPQVDRLEKHYGVKRDSAEFLAKIKEDVVKYATKGAEAVSAAVRDIIKAIHTGVLAAAMIFNPTAISKVESFIVIPQETQVTQQQVLAQVPAEASMMSDAGKQAYERLVPALKGKIGNKFITIADKPSGRIFVFKSDGSFVLQKKSLFGLAKGDLYKGNNDLPQNRVTPAGLFGIKIIDAAKGGNAAKTAGEYDFGKVFALEDPDAVVTFMHSVWLKEKDAPQRAAALKSESAADSRYSFGCINVDKETYRELITKYGDNMDGSKLFVVPDVQSTVNDFITGNVADDRLVREGVQPVMRTVSTPVRSATQTAGVDRSVVGKEEQTPSFNSKSAKFMEFSDLEDEVKGISDVREQFADMDIEGALDFVSDWQVVNDRSKNAFHGQLKTENGRYIGVLNLAKMSSPAYAAETVRHEVAHAVDMAPHGGVYSHQLEMNVEIKDGKVVPFGEVAKEMFALYENNKAFTTFLDYPFNISVHTDLDTNGKIESELFAQIFSIYTNPKYTDYIASVAPKTSTFLEEVINDIRTTTALQIQKSTTAATRAIDFRNRYTARRNQREAGVYGGDRQTNEGPFNSRGQGREFTADQVINDLPRALQKSARARWTNIKSLVNRGLYASAITEDLAGMAKKYMPSVSKYLQAQYNRQATRLSFERRIEDILAAFDKLPQNLQGEGKNSVNAYIYDSTREKKWGYYPGEHQIGTKLFEVDPDFKERFDAFPPAAQKLIKDVFQHGYEALKMKQNAAVAAVEREFVEREKNAGSDADLQQAIAKEKKQMLKRISSLHSVNVGNPYAYLGRYGDYVVTAKSPEFKAYEEAAEGAQGRVNPDYITGDAQQAKNWLQDHINDPTHYVVEFAETQGEADAIAADLIATGQYDLVDSDAHEKEANASYSGGYDLYLGVKGLRTYIEKKEGAKIDPKLDRAIGNLYLMLVAESSARQRKNVAGASKNMMRNLATSGRADAHFLASMEHSDAINESLAAMQREARRGDNRAAMPIYNELYTRHANSLDYEQTGTLSTALTRMTTLWTLSMNPAYYLQQLLQTMVFSLPYMSGRLGYFRSARALKRAYGDMAELVKGLGVNEHINFDKAPEDVRFMLKQLVDMGKIDLGIDAESKARADEQGALGKTMLKLQGINTRIESINRATAAIAAYRAYTDRYKGATGADGVRFAADVVSNTHGSYDAFNTPRVLQGDVARVALQFKRFQIIQLSMLAKLIHTSFKGASKEEKAIARASLSYITAHMAVLGGALGVPFVSQAAWIISKLFGDEDEPDNFEYKLRRMIGDDAVADLLLRGVPAAIGLESLGKKLSMENVASPFGPFVEPDLTSRAGAEKMLVGVMGPAANLGLKFTDALGLMTKGNYYKGLELALPNGVANFMKGIRFANEGITMRNGDLVMKPEEISMIDAAFQAVGLPTTTITDRQYTQKVVAEFDKFYAERSKDIKAAYVEGSRSNDSAAMAEAREDWQKLQESRVRNGYKRQLPTELFRAPAEARKRERGVVGGVETTKSNRRFVEQQVNQ